MWWDDVWNDFMLGTWGAMSSVKWIGESISYCKKGSTTFKQMFLTLVEQGVAI